MIRPVDLARPHGLSSQAVRHYEERGVIPRAERTAGGHRRYGERHRVALAAFLALVPAVGHRAGTVLVQAAHQGETAALLLALDQAHAGLARDRATLDLVAQAVAGLTAGSVETTASGRLAIGAVAHRVGVRPATLRAWERAGVVRPGRDPRTGHRVYRPDDLRDAHLAHQLRRGGYLLRDIAVVVDELRERGSQQHLAAALAQWREAVHERGLALLGGTAELHRLVALSAAGTGERPPASDPHA